MMKSTIPLDAAPNKVAGPHSNIGDASVYLVVFSYLRLACLTGESDTFAAAYHGGFKNALQYTGDPSIRASISLAMTYWFSNDFDNIACLDAGGTDACPCGTPGFWNPNWASMV